MDMHRILDIHALSLILLLHKNKQTLWAVGWFEHGCALYRCLSVCQYAYIACGDPFLHVGRGFSVDLYRILVIHALARAMWIAS